MKNEPQSSAQTAENSTFELTYTAANSTPNVPKQRYAGLWIRMMAAFIDVFLAQLMAIFIAALIGLVLGSTFPSFMPRHEVKALAIMIGGTSSLLVHWLWFTVAESSSW